MASYNPAMIKDEPLTANWKPAPDLTSFAASYAGNSSSASSGGGAYGTGWGTSTGSAVAIASASSAAGTANGAGMSSFQVSPWGYQLIYRTSRNIDGPCWYDRTSWTSRLAVLVRVVAAVG
jgi:hypothetical protein